MELEIKTRGRTQMIDITDRVRSAVTEAGLRNGICMVSVPHTTAAVTINENADPAVPLDMADILERMVPWEGGYRHLEGNSAAHVKSSLFGASEMVAVAEGRLVLGTWQGIFFCEFDGPRTRKLRLVCLSG